MKKSAFKKNSDEIIYNVINSLLACVLVLVGSISTGEITMQSIGFAAGAAIVVFITQFKNYWEGQKSEYSTIKLFNFVG